MRTTAEEIWAQTDGDLDAFICAVGTGGTLGGVSMGLKAKRRDIVIGIADPMGAALYSYYTTGELKSEGSSITEGIGQGRITANLEGVEVDRAYQIPDAEAVDRVFQMLQRGRPLPWRLQRHERRRRGAAGARARARPQDRDNAVRLWHAVIRPVCSIRTSCGRRLCRCRIGWNSKVPELPQVFA